MAKVALARKTDQGPTVFFVANIETTDVPSVLVVNNAAAGATPDPKNYTSWFRYSEPPPAGADALYVQDSTVSIAVITEDQLTPVDPPILLAE